MTNDVMKMILENFDENTPKDVRELFEGQYKKGLERYGQGVDPMDARYDWVDEAAQELVDAICYTVAQNVRRQEDGEVCAQVVRLLEAALTATLSLKKPLILV